MSTSKLHPVIKQLLLTEEEYACFLAIFLRYKDFLHASNVDEGHGIDHAIIVTNHVANALIVESQLPHNLAILLAALLHDADDHKFFASQNYENARKFVAQLAQKDLIIEMIDLVSCSKNKNKLVAESWKLLPRDADRLAAIGKSGIYRAYIYTKQVNKPLFTDQTPRATTSEQLAKIATKERFEAYRGGSDSMVDHFYDKVLHIHNMSSGNIYMRQVAATLHTDIIEFCLEFGRTGTINEEIMRSYQSYIKG